MKPNFGAKINYYSAILNIILVVYKNFFALSHIFGIFLEINIFLFYNLYYKEGDYNETFRYN